VLTNAFEKNKNMRQFKQMLESYYNLDREKGSINEGGNVRMTRQRSGSSVINNINNGSLFNNSGSKLINGTNYPNTSNLTSKNLNNMSN
jgi:hypothetical protein